MVSKDLPISPRLQVVNKYCSTPNIHWKTALDILAYIKRINEYGIIHQKSKLANVSLEVLADTDYGSKATDRRSVSGGAITCGGACCIYWFSMTQINATLL